MNKVPKDVDDLMFVLNKMLTYKNDGNKKNTRTKLKTAMENGNEHDLLLQASKVIYDMYMNNSVQVKPEKESILENKLHVKEIDELKSNIKELESTIDGLRKSNHRLRNNFQIAQNQIEVLQDKRDSKELQSDRIKWFEARDKQQSQELNQLRNQYNDVIQINKRLTNERREILNRNRPDDEKDKEIASLKSKLEKANEEEYYRKKFREIEMNKELEIESETRRLKKQQYNKTQRDKKRSI
jgi:outer membrane murein-binding lipoprotein Lpp